MANEENSYTNLHLSALTFLHPPNPPDHQFQCHCCEQSSSKLDRMKHIRVYHNEPSGYAYNSDCYLIKESRYSTIQKWHAPSDDLVADDAAVGSAVVAVGWWIEDRKDEKDEWETRVYYVDKNGTLRERTNITYFSPSVSDDFDVELPSPEKLQPPTPGWKSTPIFDPKSGATSDIGWFPTIRPLSSTKLAACRSLDGSIHVFYQGSDESVLELTFQPETGWTDSENDVVVEAGKAKSGSPLALVEGGWGGFQLFYADKGDMLKEAYSDDHRAWMENALPSYPLNPSAMLTAVAWNFGSPYFQIRLYITTATDDLHELVYSRHTGGWAPTTNQSVSGTPDEPLPLAQTSAPLSAVSAIRGKCDHETKVYFHPRRIIVAEWDVNAKTPVHAGIAKVSAGAIKKRAIEEETRVKIAEDEERKRREAEELRRKIAAEEEMLRRQPVATAEVQEAINKIGKCSQGYPWKRDVGGWRCEGGGHFVSDEDVRRERYS